MESLICKSLLWKMGFANAEDYNTTLDKMFLKNSNNDLLLELESCSSDCNATFDILQRYWKYECEDFSVDNFGKCLLEDLKTVYFSNLFTISPIRPLWTASGFTAIKVLSSVCIINLLF